MTAHRAAARLDAGTKAFRVGDYALARREFERAAALFRAQCGPDDPRTLRALSDLGAAHAALGDHAASRAAHEAVLAARRRSLGELHQDVGVSLHNLAACCDALGDIAAAIAHQTQAVSVWRAALGDTHPMLARALTRLASLARRSGNTAAAIAASEEALRILRRSAPPDRGALVAALNEWSDAKCHAGELAAAEAGWREAVPLAAAGDAARLLVKLGQSRRQFDSEDAAACFAAALRADGTLVAARHALAAALMRLGREDEARPHLDAALARQRVFIQPGLADAPRVLILASATSGNIPLDHLLPERDFTRILWFIDHAPNPANEALPPYDVVFNGLGDPDTTQGADAKLQAFVEVNRKRLLNPPALVARTRRDILPSVLAGVPGLVVPRVCRIGAAPSGESIRREVDAVGIAPPLLLRPAGAHGGAGLRRIDSWEGFAAPIADAWYATAFHDCRAADGQTRKYRIIFVNRVPYAYHLAISPDWMVHYFSAGMTQEPLKLTEEAAFLADMEAVLGAELYGALREAGARLDLDYCGMDFGIAGGRIVVFEANATMLVHSEAPTGPLAFKNAAVSRIIAALNTAVRQKE